MKKILWLAITLLLVGCVPVQPQQDQQIVNGELNQPVVVEQINEASTAPELPNLSDVEVVGGDEAKSTTNLKTTLTAAELEAHFAGQLRSLGWQHVQQQSSEGYAASSWRFMDDQKDPWTGYLILLEVMNGSDRRYAYLQIEKVK